MIHYISNHLFEGPLEDIVAVPFRGLHSISPHKFLLSPPFSISHITTLPQGTLCTSTAQSKRVAQCTTPRDDVVSTRSYSNRESKKKKSCPSSQPYPHQSICLLAYIFVCRQILLIENKPLNAKDTRLEARALPGKKVPCMLHPPAEKALPTAWTSYIF